ncbi:hypothetical protein NHE_0836 [Neorickettsia helminthoeca str. Oregon]|uniref:Uncharacterized protein n=1 Tax=Neorickettsia helminthoeca str. Oregon TaxID=1286528 RepID=X5H592_9RICK|nr:hypothetical protein [Neorickettsia helminthoeca]AHX11756.1 hypothetical protein NHE_0836 [Neorickettsia helminthoeca str. Oregon]
MRDVNLNQFGTRSMTPDLSPDIKQEVQLFLEQQTLNPQEFNYDRALLLLRKSADHNRGITWNVDDDRNIITRTLVDPSRPSFSPNDYAQQVANLYRAAVDIVKSLPPEYKTSSAKADVVITQLNKSAIRCIQTAITLEHEESCERYLKRHNGEVIGVLRNVLPQRYSINEIQSLLRIAEGYTSLGDAKHYAIETITPITGDRIIIQADYPIAGLTEPQKESLQNYCNEDWYRALHPIEQGLFQRHKDAILSGERSVSTVLRSIPCLRNAYYKEVKEVRKNPAGLDTITVLNSYIHSAALSGTQKDKETREEVAQRNYKQLCTRVPDRNIDIMTLCSRVPGQAFLERHFPKLSSTIFDTHIVDTTAAAVPEENLIIIPTNILRCISKNTIKKSCKAVFSGYISNHLLEEKEGLQDLVKYLTKDPSFLDRGNALRAAKVVTYSLEDPREKMLALEVIELRRLSLKQSGWRGRFNSFIEIITAPFRRQPRNKNARIAGMLTTLWNKTQPDRCLAVSCKSGKDRTGYESMLADSLGIKMQNPDCTIPEIQSLIAKSAHIQFLASGAGGKPGCFGLKGVATDEFGGAAGTINSSLFIRAARTSSKISLDKQAVDPATNPELYILLAKINNEITEGGEIQRGTSETTSLLSISSNRRARLSSESLDRISLFVDSDDVLTEEEFLSSDTLESQPSSSSGSAGSGKELSSRISLDTSDPESLSKVSPDKKGKESAPGK